MPSSVIYILLAIALLAPVVAATVVRVLGSRINERQLAGIATFAVVLAIGSTLVLVWQNPRTLRVGDLTLLVASTRVDDAFAVAVPTLDTAPLPPATAPLTAATAPALPSVTPRAATPTAATLATTATAAATNTPAPTSTPVPATATPDPATATPEPPTATPEPPAAAEPRTYTVQPGDTLRSIAEDFDVEVADLLAANDLTPDEADSLGVGQELIIP